MNKRIKEKTAIIEPHDDDAWFSLGGYMLENPNTRFKIYTICECNQGFTKWIAKKINNIETKSLNFGNAKRNEKHGIWYKENINEKELKEKLIEIKKQNDNILLPIGIGHPLHEIIGSVQMDCERYLDNPYHNKPLLKPKIILKTINKRREIIEINKIFPKKLKLIKDFGKRPYEFIQGGGSRFYGIQQEYIYTNKVKPGVWKRSKARMD